MVHDGSGSANQRARHVVSRAVRDLRSQIHLREKRTHQIGLKVTGSDLERLLALCEIHGVQMPPATVAHTAFRFGLKALEKGFQRHAARQAKGAR